MRVNQITIFCILVTIILLFPSKHSWAKLGPNEIPNLDPIYDSMLGSRPYNAQDPNNPDIFHPAIDARNHKILEAMQWCKDYSVDCEAYRDWDSDLRNLRNMFLQYLYIYHNNLSYSELGFNHRRPGIINYYFMTETDFKRVYAAQMAHVIWLDVQGTQDGLIGWRLRDRTVVNLERMLVSSYPYKNNNERPMEVSPGAKFLNL